MNIGDSQFRDGFCSRTKSARESAGFTQDDIAEILGIKQDRYKHYEVRSLLPHKFVRTFCVATRTSADWLFTPENGANRPKRKPHKGRQPERQPRNGDR